MRSGDRILLTSHSAADCFKFETRVLGSLHGAAERLPNERRDLDASLLYV